MGIFSWARQKALERQYRWHATFSHDIEDPDERQRSLHFLAWADHGVLRRFWRNFAEVGPGLYRANHPDAARLDAYAAMGIKSVLNLRGVTDQSPYKFEDEACRRLGLKLVVVSMASRQAPKRESLLALIEAFRSLPRPILMHCKSGADRTSLAAAIWKLVIDGADLAEARTQLSPRFLHFRWSKTGVLDHVLDLYEARLAKGEIGFEDWLRQEYSQEEAAASYAAR